jgi:hypothetical protein
MVGEVMRMVVVVIGGVHAVWGVRVAMGVGVGVLVRVGMCRLVGRHARALVQG